MTNHTNTEYWAEALQDNTNSIAPLLSKMYEDHCNLSTEDQYLLRELIARNASLVHLLNRDMSEPEPKKLWKKILNK